MFRRTVCSISAAVAVAVSASAHAQIGRSRGASQEPGYWIGLSVGYVEGFTVSDQKTGGTWNFGYTTALRATVEKKLQQGATIGLGASFANAPLTYSSPDVFSVSCPGRCGDAHADINQYILFLRSGGGTGLHGIYSFEGGVTQFSNFRDSTSAKLPPDKSGYDPTFAFGGGFGYGLSSSSEIYVGEMLNYIFHKQQGSSQGAPRQLTFRVGFRVGF